LIKPIPESLFDPMAFSHGHFAVNEDGVGIMNNPVKNGIRQCFFTNLFMPAARSKLGAKDSRSILMSGFNDLQLDFDSKTRSNRLPGA